MIVYGDLVKHKIPESIMRNDLLGIREKIAIKAFQDNPHTDKLTVSLKARDSTHYRLDLEDYL